MTRVRTQIGRRYRQSRDILRAEGMRGITSRARLTASGQWLVQKYPEMEVRRSRRRGSRSLASVSSPCSDGRVRATAHSELGDGPAKSGLRRPHDAVSHHQLPRGARLRQPHLFLRLLPCRSATITSRSSGTITASTARSASVDQGLADAHAVVATAWNYRLPGLQRPLCAASASTSCRTSSLTFYPVGSLSFLAENTYRMGFHAITAGAWLSQEAR